MYKVYCDSYLLYDDRLEDYKIFNPKVNLELNKTGSFEFVIYNNHPYYGMIKKLKSIITVYQDDYLLFRGRVLNDELGFYEEKQVFCEGELAFLLDSILRPYSHNGSIISFLSAIIRNHNSQVSADHQFTLGNVTVTDPNDTIVRSDIDYTNSWDVINKKLIDLLGGYIVVRHSDDISYIDYLADFNTIGIQKVEFAKNLLDMKRIRKGEEIATALVPLGAKIEGTDERLTIKSVNNNIDYIYDQDAVNAYGWIFRKNEWDDVTIASNLLTKAQNYLNEIINLDETIELSAADLATVNKDITSFRLGTYVNVVSNPHGIDENMLVSKLSINILKPAENKLTLGKKVKGLTENIKYDQELIIKDVQGEILDSVIQETISQASSLIDQSATAIRTEVAEGYYTKTEGEELGQQISGLSTQFTQTTESFEFKFTQVESDITDLDAGMTEVTKYIRFENGNIILGESGNQLTLKIENDRIAFFDGYNMVAYFSNNKLHVTDGEFLNELKLGSFAFVPRTNGNLSFERVGD